LTAKVLTDEHARRTIVATTGRCPEARCEQYRRRGAAVWVLASRRGRVSLRALMRRLGRMGMLRVLCEGGARMAEALIRETGVDELHLMIAPRVLGGGPPVTDGPGWLLGAEPRFRITGCSTCGTDVLVRAVPVHEVEKRPCSRG
jgi:diaminohydroxyphosphoribosylaminopyrimidine deaminase/5-amino-6-(5-phosphoribosylamino)uracil reductase